MSVLQQRPGRWRTLALFLAFAGFYLLFASGHFYSTDEETVYLLTERIVEAHTVTLLDVWGVSGAIGPDGQLYAATSPGQSVLAIPFYSLGVLTAHLLPPDARGYATRFAVSLLNPVVAAATVAGIYALLLQFTRRQRIALVGALIYGLASSNWPHGRTFFAEPLTAFCLVLCWYCLRRGTERVTPLGWLIAGGVLMPVALSVKPHAIFAVPFLGLYALARLFMVHRTFGSSWGGIRTVISPLLALAGGLVLGALPLAFYNWMAFGGPLTTGYSSPGLASNFFAYPLGDGLPGLTIGTGKGLLWYAPPLLLAILGWWRFFRQAWLDALLCLAVVGTVYFVFAQFSFWHGDGSWGPRYIYIALPFALVPMIGLLDGARFQRWRIALVTFVVVCGVVVQLLGVLVNFDWYILRVDQRDRHFTPIASPIVGHARYLGERIALWQERLWPPANSAVLVNGFDDAEPPVDQLRTKPGMFPRWTTGAGVIALHARNSDPLIVKITMFDHRPAPLRVDRPLVLINDRPIEPAVLTVETLNSEGSGWIYQFTVPAAALEHYQARVTVQSTTWNPHSLGVSDRDEPLGVFVNNVEVWQQGQPLTVREALPLDPMPQSSRQRFWWHNDDRGHWNQRLHLADLWFWYLAVAGFSRSQALAWGACYGLGAVALLGSGLVLGWRTLPDSVRTRRRRPRRRKQRSRVRQ